MPLSSAEECSMVLDILIDSHVDGYGSYVEYDDDLEIAQLCEMGMRDRCKQPGSSSKLQKDFLIQMKVLVMKT